RRGECVRTKGRAMKEKIGNVVVFVLGLYLFTTQFAAPYYWYRDVKEHDSFLRAVFWSPLVGELKGVVWPYFAFASSREDKANEEAAAIAAFVRARKSLSLAEEFVDIVKAEKATQDDFN